MRLSLAVRETAELRGQYEQMRVEHGFRLLDYSVDSDAVSPRACFQFSESLPGRGTDFSPFVAVAGQDKPAVSATDKQLCVEGLKHGDRYQITLRAGLPSTVHETLTKSAEYTVFVRDRKPFVRFSGKAYVLPKTGQRGIPVLSVNTGAVKLVIYRIGDRNLIDTLSGYDFQQNISDYQAGSIASRRGEKVWSGELAVEQKLNTEVTTAFPVDKAIGALSSGVYVMTAQPKEAVASNDDLATQWFIVSDLGLTAYSGHDGIDVFIHSLASAEPSAAVEVRLVARNNEVLGVGQTDANGFVHFAAGLARGEGGLAPAAIVASAKGSGGLFGGAVNEDYAFLSLKSSAFDLSDRGVGGREVPVGLDAFVYTERGVYRTGETVHVTSLLRDARGIAAPSVPLTLVVERPDGVEYRRALVAGRRHRRTLAGRAHRFLRDERHLARCRLHRSQASAGRRDHIHGRGLCARPHRVRSHLRIQIDFTGCAGAGHGGRAFPLRRAGLQSRPVRLGDHRRRQGAARISRLCFRAERRGRWRRSGSNSRTCRRPAPPGK